MDSGICAVKNIQEAYDVIEKDEILIVCEGWEGEDSTTNIPSITPNYLWTHNRCTEKMKATQDEICGNQICAGIQGYKVNGKYQIYIDEGYRYSLDKEIIWGYHDNHRHDQSIYSILAVRYKLPYQSMVRFGEWKAIDYSPRQVLYVHRCSYENLDGLIFKCDT